MPRSCSRPPSQCCARSCSWATKPGLPGPGEKTNKARGVSIAAECFWLLGWLALGASDTCLFHLGFLEGSLERPSKESLGQRGRHVKFSLVLPCLQEVLSCFLNGPGHSMQHRSSEFKAMEGFLRVLGKVRRTRGRWVDAFCVNLPRSWLPACLPTKRPPRQ